MSGTPLDRQLSPALDQHCIRDLRLFLRQREPGVVIRQATHILGLQRSNMAY